MAFVHSVPHQPPSPRAVEPGRRLSKVIEGFRRERIDATGTEVRQALR